VSRQRKRRGWMNTDTREGKDLRWRHPPLNRYTLFNLLNFKIYLNNVLKVKVQGDEEEEWCPMSATPLPGTS